MSGTGSPPPETDAEKLTSAGVFHGVLKFMDRPWKAVVVVVLVVIFGIGYLLWEERARIADAVLNEVNSHAALDEAAFIRDAPKLLRDTRADYALLVDVDLNDNLMTDRVGIDTDGNRWVPATGPQVALSPASSMPTLVKFLSNEVVCVVAADALNEDVRALAVKGYQRVCMVSVPPILGVGIGGLMVAWKQALMPTNEQRVGLVMKSAALKFATW